MKLFNNSILSKIFRVNRDCFVIKINNKKQVKESFKSKDCKNLDNCLKQLEFISCLEMTLDNKKEDNYSLNFLLELSKIKHHAELNTLRSINYCKG
ncbi:hypothetical protein [Lacinutrix algicola]|uniref:hypothetical protein n=1 Tax=Lacinutrix algicola TaxID=342954 RepID=UPI0006E4324B|nr:hypothetical protein [Lacinutrix algicola]